MSFKPALGLFTFWVVALTTGITGTAEAGCNPKQI